MVFRLVPKSVTLNGVMAIILRYFAEFGSFRSPFRKIGWLPINIFFLRINIIKYTNKHDGRAVLFAAAGLFLSYFAVFGLKLLIYADFGYIFPKYGHPSY